VAKEFDIGSKRFTGERRDVSTVKRLFEACTVAKDVKLFPATRVSKRDGYQKLYHSPYVYASDPNSDIAQPTVLPTVSPDTTIDPITPVKKTVTPVALTLGSSDITLPGGGTDKLKIKAIHHYPMRTKWGIEMRHVVQMNDERFYKYSFGANAGWVALENTYKIDNTTDWWYKRLLPTVANGGLDVSTIPISEVRARFFDVGGTLRAGIGLGAKKTPIWYDWIDRYFFTNDAGNKYTDNYLDVTPLQPPRDDVVVAPAVKVNNLYTNPAEADAWNKFAVYSGDAVIATAYSWFPALPAGLRNRLVGFFNYKVADDGKITDVIWSNGVTPSKDVIPHEENSIYFFVGISYMYGYQESQIHVVKAENIDTSWQTTWGHPELIIPNTVVVGMSFDRYMGDIISVKLKLGLTTLETIDDNSYPIKTSQRITGVRIWLGRLGNKNDKPENVLFYPVKDVKVSSNDTFKSNDLDGIIQGNHVWKRGTHDPADPLGFTTDFYYYLALIDVNDWLAGLDSGDAASVMGHSLYLEDTTKKLTASPFLEAYRYAELVKGVPYYAGIRLGVNNPVENEFAMMWATAFSDTGGMTQGASAITPDIINPESNAYVAKTPIKNIRKLDDNTLGIVTENSVINFDATHIKPSDENEGGSTSPDSAVTQENGVISYRSGAITRYDGVEQRELSLRIKKSDDGGTYKGLDDVYNDTTVHSFFSKKLQKLFVFVEFASNDWTIFVFDYVSREWLRYDFYHQFKCGCVAVDGQLDFSDGTYIYRFPLGIDDAGQPINWLVRSADVNWDSRLEIAMNSIYAYFKSTTSVIKASLFRDRETTPVDISFPARTTPGDTWENVPETTNHAQRTIAVQLQSTTPSTTEVVEIEKVTIDADTLERIG